MPTKKHKASRALPYFICILASLFYLYDFAIRILPGTIVHDLMRQYGMSAAGLGLLSSFFFVGYMVMQVPCGLLYDRYGPHRLLTITCFIASIATFCFIATDYFAMAAIARLFMGVGSAFAYIGALVLALRWLPHRYFALAAGLIQLMGALGAIMGEAPIAKLVEHQGAFFVTTLIAVIGLVLTVLFWLFIQDYPPGKAHQFQQVKLSTVIKQLKYVTHNSQSWAAALYGFAIWAPISIFAALWAIPFLASLYHISNAHAASMASLLWVGVGLGGPVFGWVSGQFNSRRWPLIVAATMGLFAALLIVYVPHISKTYMLILLFVFGAASSAQAVTFGVVQDNNPPGRAGTAAGFNNMAIVMGGALLQPLTGALLHGQWDGQVLNGLHIYSIANYRFALVVLPICFAVGLVAACLFIRETHCQTNY